jgi:hypothetical protein
MLSTAISPSGFQAYSPKVDAQDHAHLGAGRIELLDHLKSRQGDVGTIKGKKAGNQSD